ncbi:family 43 glycosylhydrolase [Streptosporangium sp. NPDC002721]|uniref:family 43 glycosylhydrolase n=1 Tax=Streptosporangium sp. NPDC002721 TaxID=3366188 RepID=UPI003674E8C6
MRLSPTRAIGAALLLGAAVAVPAVTAQAAVACRVDYAVASQWPGGFTGNVTVRNLGDPVNGWRLTWNFTAGQQISQAWNATATQSGTAVTATDAGYNAAIPSGGNTTFGFNATGTGTGSTPADFALNGVPCTGAPVTPTPTPTPTVSPTPTPGPRNTFTNPIKSRGPDPWLTQHGGYYYLATTTWNSTITMRRSRTLGGLATAPDTVVFNLAGRANGCCNMWAPEFHLLDGPNGKRWYMYYVAGQNVADFNPTQRLHVLESAGTDPMGPYTFKADLGGDWQLDASVLRHGSRLYLMGTYNPGTQSLFITPLSNPWTISGSRVRLSSPTYAWERQTAAVAEGPEPLYHNGKTFVIYSASACWGPDYKLGMLTLTGADPLNPAHWTKHPTPVFQRSDANSVYAPGHNGFFTSPDGTEDWIVYHANSSAGGGCDMNRSTRAQKFTWNADGTPNFGTPVRLGTTLTSPSGESAS